VGCAAPLCNAASAAAASLVLAPAARIFGSEPRSGCLAAAWAVPPRSARRFVQLSQTAAGIFLDWMLAEGVLKRIGKRYVLCGLPDESTPTCSDTACSS
jgi:hypothetical protein